MTYTHTASHCSSMTNGSLLSSSAHIWYLVEPVSKKHKKEVDFEIRRIETFGKFGYDFHIHNLNCVWIQGLEQYSRGWRTQTWYHLLNLIHSAYGLQHKASVFFFLFLWVLYLHSRRLAALGWKIAISRSKVIFLFDFPLLYVYSFYSLVCRVLEETSAMLLEIP